MEPIFDRTGETIAWRFRDVLYDAAGKGIGFVRNHGMYTLEGRCVGSFEDGLYRDRSGAVLAFERDATGGPLLPIPRPIPTAPKPRLRPTEPRFEPAGRLSMRRVAWCDDPLGALLAGGTAATG